MTLFSKAFYFIANNFLCGFIELNDQLNTLGLIANYNVGVRDIESGLSVLCSHKVSWKYVHMLII